MGSKFDTSQLIGYYYWWVPYRFSRPATPYSQDNWRESPCYRLLKDMALESMYEKDRVVIGNTWFPVGLLPAELPAGLEGAEEFVPMVSARTGRMLGAFFRQCPEAYRSRVHYRPVASTPPDLV